MTAVVYWWRARWRAMARSTVLTTLMIGVLVTVALGALVSARRTASAYGRYLRSVNSSDVMVNTFLPDVARARTIAALPGVRSSRVYVGLNAQPVFHGREDDSFLTDSVDGSLDGEYFVQDRMTVLSGSLPRRADEIALTPKIAAQFGAVVGSRVTYNFYGVSADPRQPPPLLGPVTYVLTAIVSVPPVLVDETEIQQTAVLPPAATQPRLASVAYVWQGIQLSRGEAGLAEFRTELAHLAAADHEGANVSVLATIHRHVQNAVDPQAIALALFGVAATLAVLVIGAQTGIRAVARSAVDRQSLRAAGALRWQQTAVGSIDTAPAFVLGTILGAVGGWLASAAAPIGAVRPYDPARGIHADFTVLAGGSAGILLCLLAAVAIVAWRSTNPRQDHEHPHASSAAVLASRAGVPPPAVLGTQMALEPGSGRTAVPVRSTLVGTAAAVVAVMAALVFGASLRALVSRPARFGWAWDVMVQDQGGYGRLDAPNSSWAGAPSGDLHVIQGVVGQDPAVAAWSVFGFGQATVDGVRVPAIGLDHQLGRVEPPTTSGRSLAGPDEITLGVSTIRQLHKAIGDKVDFRDGGAVQRLTIVGTTTFPSIGIGNADHPSLGVGALVAEETLVRAALGANGNCSATGGANEAFTECPSTAVFRLRPRANAIGFVNRLLAANPDPSTPGAVFVQPLVRGAQIVNSQQMGNEPLLLAGLLVFAAVASLLLTQLAVVSRRQRDMAILKALGFTQRQLRAAAAWQATTSAAIVLVVGVPVGVAAGRVSWLRFADSVGAVRTPAVPLVPIVLAIIGFLVLINLAASWPGAVAARTPAATLLRNE